MTVSTASASRASMSLRSLERVPAQRSAETLAVATKMAFRSADTVALSQVAPAAQASLFDASALFDETTGSWTPEALPVAADRPARVAGLNQPGGPQIDPAALADPTAYTAAATARRRESQPKDAGFAVARVAEPAFNRLFGRAKVGDAVPEMPADLLRRIESHLQPGDILLQGADQDFRSENRGLYIHGMVYLGRGQDGTGYVVHAIGQAQASRQGELKGAVRLSAFNDSIVRDLPGTDRLAVLRPAKLSQADFNRLATFAVGEVGKPYDYAFNGKDGERYYCTELVAKGIACLDPTMQIKPDPALPLPMITDLSLRQAQTKGMLLPVMTVNPRPDR